MSKVSYERASMNNSHRQAPWVICPECDGDGHHARAMGEINREEWDEEDFDHYMAGGYDSACDECGGSGKVREGAEPVRAKPWYETCPIARAERAMGA